jgi:hypothetical protein
MADTLITGSDSMQAWGALIVPWISAFTTIVLAFLTWRYVKLTKHMADAMRISREPSVYIDFEIPGHEIRFSVGNSGQTPAKNLKFEVVQDLPWLGFGGDSQGVSSIPIIKSGISYLTPGRVLKFSAGFFAHKEIEREEHVFKMNIKYENEAGKLFTRSVIIDMIQYADVLFESFKDSTLAVAEAIKDTEASRRTHGNIRSLFLHDRFGKKECPICAELIPEKAKKCSHCGELLKDSSDNSKEPPAVG